MGTVEAKNDDGQNRLIADASLIVTDPLTGLNRKVFAGQPVPLDLVEAYEEMGGKGPEAEPPAPVEGSDDVSLEADENKNAQPAAIEGQEGQDSARPWPYADVMGYVDLTALKETLSLAGENFADDDLNLGIASATTVVDSMCGRSFAAPDTDPTVRLYEPRRDDWLELDDLIELTSIESMPIGGTEWVLWDAVDFELRPLNAEADGEPWTELVLPKFSLRFPLTDQRQVRVTGKFGWTAVPDAVIQATGILAARLVKRAREGPSFGVTSIGADAVAMRVYAGDPDVENLLGSYMRTLRLA